MGTKDLPFIKKYESLIWNNLNFINSKRVKDTSFILMILSVFLIIIDIFNHNRGLWSNQGYRYLFYTHIVLLLISIIYFTIYFLRSGTRENPLFDKSYTLSFSLLMLNLTATISGWVDQQIHGEITVYSMGCFVIAVLFYFKPKHTIIIYIQSFVFFVVYLALSQPNIDIRQGDYINSAITLTLVCFISVTISNLMQRDFVYKYKLEELAQERSEALIRKENEVSRLQQLTLIGEMAAGIAHEIRNPMTAVRGFLQLLGNREYNKKDKPHFDLMIEELDRANSIITEFLSLAKDKKMKLEMKNLKSLILEIVPLIETNMAYNQTLILDLKETPELLLDQSEIRQVILNLAKNAIDAMPSGGNLTIKTCHINSAVVLEVIDEGSGIDPSIIDKIGTPFFTTKDTGTGLGLAICYSIIDRHNGKLEIEPSPEGSTFRLIFEI